MSWELFHQISDPESARVRRFVTAAGLVDQVRFRNIEASESAARDLAQIDAKVPTLRVGHDIIEGADAIVAFLSAQAKP